jgi:hypothetical protein
LQIGCGSVNRFAEKLLGPRLTGPLYPPPSFPSRLYGDQPHFDCSREERDMGDFIYFIGGGLLFVAMMAYAVWLNRV